VSKGHVISARESTLQSFTPRSILYQCESPSLSLLVFSHSHTPTHTTVYTLNIGICTLFVNFPKVRNLYFTSRSSIQSNVSSYTAHCCSPAP
jgi:hypothetical protein